MKTVALKKIEEAGKILDKMAIHAIYKLNCPNCGRVLTLYVHKKLEQQKHMMYCHGCDSAYEIIIPKEDINAE